MEERSAERRNTRERMMVTDKSPRVKPTANVTIRAVAATTKRIGPNPTPANARSPVVAVIAKRRRPKIRAVKLTSKIRGTSRISIIMGAVSRRKTTTITKTVTEVKRISKIRITINSKPNEAEILHAHH